MAIWRNCSITRNFATQRYHDDKFSHFLADSSKDAMIKWAAQNGLGNLGGELFIYGYNFQQFKQDVLEIDLSDDSKWYDILQNYDRIPSFPSKDIFLMIKQDKRILEIIKASFDRAERMAKVNKGLFEFGKALHFLPDFDSLNMFYCDVLSFFVGQLTYDFLANKYAIKGLPLSGLLGDGNQPEEKVIKDKLLAFFPGCDLKNKPCKNAPYKLFMEGYTVGHSFVTDKNYARFYQIGVASFESGKQKRSIMVGFDNAVNTVVAENVGVNLYDVLGDNVYVNLANAFPSGTGLLPTSGELVSFIDLYSEYRDAIEYGYEMARRKSENKKMESVCGEEFAHFKYDVNEFIGDMINLYKYPIATRELQFNKLISGKYPNLMQGDGPVISLEFVDELFKPTEYFDVVISGYYAHYRENSAKFTR